MSHHRSQTHLSSQRFCCVTEGKMPDRELRGGRWQQQGGAQVRGGAQHPNLPARHCPPPAGRPPGCSLAPGRVGTGPPGFPATWLRRRLTGSARSCGGSCPALSDRHDSTSCHCSWRENVLTTPTASGRDVGQGGRAGDGVFPRGLLTSSPFPSSKILRPLAWSRGHLNSINLSHKVTFSPQSRSPGGGR